MPRALPNSHKDIGKSVVHLLKNGRLFGRLFSADVIANLLNTAAEVNIDAEPRFTEDIVTAAFSTGYETRAILLANFGIHHTDAIVFSHISLCHHMEPRGKPPLGCFRNKAEARAAAELGVDHLVKTITFLHNIKLKHVALDANGTGKDAVDIAHALIASLEKLEVYAKGSKCIAITGDAGGSGAVQSQFEILVDLKFFNDFCRFIRCTLHGQNNCLQNSIDASMGPPGRGNNTCSQLLYLPMKISRELIKSADGKHTLFDHFRHKNL
eukprot:scaffold6096_cov39-Cyclotella_meneghiniana.AAC.5